MNERILWQPSESFKSESQLRAYILWLAQKKFLHFDNYDELWQWSVDSHESFWESLWEYFDIISHADYTSICSKDTMPGVRWFEGARLNYAEHVFRMRSDGRDALIFVNEKECRKISWQELEQSVKAFQSFLISKGIKAGDRVAAYLPNIPEAIIAFLAVNSLGAVWSCCSPDFGVETVLERFQQIQPKLLIAADGYRYAGKEFDRTEEIRKIKEGLDSLEGLVMIPYLAGQSVPEDSVNWLSILEDHKTSDTLEFEALDFNHAIWVLYSSGTTGKPKAITHSNGGVLLEHLKYMAFHNNVREGENFFWFTTTGWMMWNFLQASLLAGATAILYDGSPAYPDLEVLWSITEDLPIHHFGTSAPYLTALMKRGIQVGSKYNMSSLRSIGSTGAPLPSEAFDWIYENISSDVWLCSMSGGTDVCTAFVGGNPLMNVQRGRIQSRALGCALYAYDEEGNKVLGSLGEMVIEKPMPSMPVYFWNDDGMERYRKSYFEKFPAKWCHGDWIRLYEDGSLIIQGRSDATLNRKGIRIGTAEIYSVIDKFPEIKDSLIINLERTNGDDIMPLFVVCNEGYNLDEALINRIKHELRTQCSPRHVPDAFYKVSDIPYTLSGKKMEVPVKKLLMGMERAKLMNEDAMRNPESLDQFVSLIEEING